MIGSIRAGLSLAGFLALTLPLMPLQWLLIKSGSRAQRALPHWYHKQVCRLLGVRLHVHGSIRDDQAVLVVSNHVTWLDIPVLSAAAPVSFVAKKEVADWPLAGSLARLQRTVFVDRGSRSSVGKTSNEMASRLHAGDHVVLFAEGTSSDGNKVLPFKTSLFAAAKPPRRKPTRTDNDSNSNGGESRTGSKTSAGAGNNAGSNNTINGAARETSGSGPALGAGAAANTAHPTVYVQTAALAYVARHGLPLGRLGRQDVAWYGDEEMTSHAWTLLKNGPIDVHLIIGAPVPLDDFKDRKTLAQYTELQIRDGVVTLLRGRSPSQPLKAAEPPADWRKAPLSPTNGDNNATWV